MTTVAAPRWRKSSFSGDQDCVEVAWPPGVAAVRDTKNVGAELRFSRSAMERFTQSNR